MCFTYEKYAFLLSLINDKGYSYSDYLNWQNHEKSVILRHDIDYDVAKSVKLAEIEAEREVTSTYFVLLSSDFYNVFSRKNIDMLHEIANQGHSIGLHFDEMSYPHLFGQTEQIATAIAREADILQTALDLPVKTVSMHRPSREILESNLQIPGIINSYSDVFFREFKYLSDSRRRWREPLEEIITSQRYDKLHILTHAFWYNDSEISLSDSLHCFIDSAGNDRYQSLVENFTNLEQALGEK